MKLSEQEFLFLDINIKPFTSTSIGPCANFNLYNPEKTLHFIRLCHIFEDIARKFFQQKSTKPGLSHSPHIDACLESCLRYRKFILNEFAWDCLNGHAFKKVHSFWLKTNELRQLQTTTKINTINLKSVRRIDECLALEG